MSPLVNRFGPPTTFAPTRSATWLANASIIWRTKMRRAGLCGSRLARARSRARSTTSGSRTTVSPLEGDLPRLVRRPLPVGYGPGHDRRHLRTPLDLRRRVRFLGRRGHAGHEAAGGGEHDRRLAQPGQHLADVSQECRVRTDDQHRPLGERVAVVVEQVRGPVQRDRGLARAGTALDHEESGLVGADDLILLGLDRLDDVAHPAGPGRRQCRQQSSFAREVAVVHGCVGGRVGSAGGRAVDPPSTTARSSVSSVMPTTSRHCVVMCRRSRAPSGCATVAR